MNGASVFEFGSRQLRRTGTGSRSPRRDGDDTTIDVASQVGTNNILQGADGIPDLPPTFTFDTS